MQNISELSSYSFGTSVGGYGICNIGFAKYAKRLGTTVYFHPKYAPVKDSQEWRVLDQEEKDVFENDFKECKVGISGTTPFNFNENRSPVKVAMTMAESDRIGEEWVRACNGMTHIIVPNEFYKEVFQESGVTVPIKVLPSGIDTERYYYVRRNKRNDFTFGLCGYLNDRKSVLEVIQAFCSEFEANEPVRLFLHTTNHFFRYYKNFTDPRIKLTWDYKPFSDMMEFYKELDCFVFPSKAEGIGLPPREAMATGLPVILTEYSGLSDIANPLFSYPLNVHELIPRTDMTEQPGNWAKVDVKELMYQMRYVYEHQDEARNKGRLAASVIKEKYSWEVCAKNILNFLGETYA